MIDVSKIIPFYGRLGGPFMGAVLSRTSYILRTKPLPQDFRVAPVGDDTVVVVHVNMSALVSATEEVGLNPDFWLYATLRDTQFDKAEYVTRKGSGRITMRIYAGVIPSSTTGYFISQARIRDDLPGEHFIERFPDDIEYLEEVP